MTVQMSTFVIGGNAADPGEGDRMPINLRMAALKMLYHNPDMSAEKLIRQCEETNSSTETQDLTDPDMETIADGHETSSSCSSSSRKNTTPAKSKVAKSAKTASGKVPQTNWF